MVMEKLTSPANLTDICVLAKHYIGDSSKAKDVRNNIRRELNQNPDLFCHAEGMPDGWWRLVSQRDELSRLKAQLAEKELFIEELKNVPTEDEFIERLLDRLETLWIHDKKTIGEIRKILVAVGRSDVLERLDTIIDNNSKKTKKPVEKSKPNIVVNGDYVVDKHVDNEVNGVDSGATGISVNKKDEEKNET